MHYAIGCSKSAINMKEILKHYLLELDNNLTDFGIANENMTRDSDLGHAIAIAIAQGEVDRAVLCCETGIGMAIAANRVKGIRAAVCHDLFSTEQARIRNNAQIFCVGAQVIAPQQALHLLAIWCSTQYIDNGSNVIS